LGLTPTWVIPILNVIPQTLFHTPLVQHIDAQHWLWLTPVDIQQASYAPSIVFLGMLILSGLAFWFLHPKGTEIRRSKMWSCGNPHTNVRMQYNASSFSQPIRRIFNGIYHAKEEAYAERPFHALLSKRIHYHVHIDDRIVEYFYQPIGRVTLHLAKLMNKQHQRGIHAYLTYTFVTVILLLTVFALIPSLLHPQA